jgi:hypothetical protein
MADMNVPLDSQQLKKLIELAYLGEWLINAHHDTDFQDEAATAALQPLLAAAEGDGVGRDAETGQYYLESDWTERLYDQYVLDYDDHVFWDELVERLAQRDLARRRGVPVEEVNREDDLRELRPLEDHYRHECEEHGLDRLEISNDF